MTLTESFIPRGSFVKRTRDEDGGDGGEIKGQLTSVGERVLGLQREVGYRAELHEDYSQTSYRFASGG